MPYPWSAGNVLTATDLNSALAAKYDSAPAINAQVGTTYTFVLADATAGKTITASNASASTYTVPPQSSVAFSAGALLRVTNLGAGVVTFAGGVGVTVTNTAATLPQYQTATLVRTASDAWTVIPAGGSGLSFVASATATASSAVSINSCFTSLYDNYRLMIRLIGSTTASPSIRLRVGGVDVTAANYEYQLIQPSSTGVVAARTTGATSWEVAQLAGTDYNLLVIDIASPALAATTQMMLNGVNFTSAIFGGTYYARHTLTTAYDGFSLLANTGTITTAANGIRVYGYRNA